MLCHGFLTQALNGKLTTAFAPSLKDPVWPSRPSPTPQPVKDVARILKGAALRPSDRGHFGEEHCAGLGRVRRGKKKIRKKVVSYRCVAHIPMFAPPAPPLPTNRDSPTGTLVLIRESSSTFPPPNNLQDKNGVPEETRISRRKIDSPADKVLQTPFNIVLERERETDCQTRCERSRTDISSDN